MDRYRTKRRYYVTNIRQALYFIALYTYVLSDDPWPRNICEAFLCVSH